MDNRIIKWLTDILVSINEVNEFIGTKPDFEIYEKNKMMKRAVERELEIIGEAVNRIKKKNSAIELSFAEKIIGLRNKVAHEYDVIDDAIIWDVVNLYLPGLKEEVEFYINAAK
jgi:uncharacterized protein with HEPN domain